MRRSDFFSLPFFWRGYPLVFVGFVLGWFFVFGLVLRLDCGWIRRLEAG